MKPELNISINTSKILKEELFQGKTGRFLNLALWANRDGADKYGNTHFVTQSVSKAARDKGVRGPIIGNAKPCGDAKPEFTPTNFAKDNAPSPAQPEDDVPF